MMMIDTGQEHGNLVWTVTGTGRAESLKWAASAAPYPQWDGETVQTKGDTYQHAVTIIKTE